MTDLKAIEGTEVSALCFGCMQFGGTVDGQASRDMYEACRAAGVNFFDTAHTYTGGEAERLFGLFSRQDREAYHRDQGGLDGRQRAQEHPAPIR